LTDDNDVNAAAVAVTAAVAAKCRIDAALLRLAREIRKPRAYTGYSAFVLMALRMKCQPCVWEGSTFFNLVNTYAPWAMEECTQKPHVLAIPCALMPKTGGSVECVPISPENPLSQTRHFVAGLPVPVSDTAVAAQTPRFEVFYAALGVSPLPTICDGDCAWDIMTMMLGQPQNLTTRSALRIDISDYLIERLSEPWMHDLMVALQELDFEDVELYRSGGAEIVAAPIAPAAAVAEPADQSAIDENVVEPDAETFAAMRWASKLHDGGNVLGLIRSLPKEIVEEQVQLYRRREETAAARKAEATPPIQISNRNRYSVRMLVAKRFHAYCHEEGFVAGKKAPYGAMRKFIKENIQCKGNLKAPQSCQIRRWYKAWSSSPANVSAAVNKNALPGISEKSLLRSRAPKLHCLRKRAPGAGRPVKAPLIREALYEWWSSIRHAIDWKQLIAENRSRGKKHLARFPRAFLRLKVNEYLQDDVYACLLNGIPVRAFTPSGWWFRRWEEDHGLSMRHANRKYAVPRKVQKERMEIGWVNLFRIRLFILLSFGYDPLISNLDQTPFHHNETGSQDKAILAVRGATVPVVEGKNDVMSRWTATLSTESVFTAVAGGKMPAAEVMYTGQKDGPLHRRLQEFHRSRGFPSWFTVTVGPKGSYREEDVIEWMRRHLEHWKEGRDWRVLLVDDYSAHKTRAVWALAWSRGYILLVHGGGVTPVAQTPDTDLNEHVRRSYGNKESILLIDKMRSGQVVPKLKQEECMELMFEVLSDPQLHRNASEGYKKVGQTIDLYGKEDVLVCREAGRFWNEETLDKFASMRPKMDAELAAVAEEFDSGGITWCQRDVKRLITPYPAHKRADAVLERLGEDFSHDDIHALEDADDDNNVDDASTTEEEHEEAPNDSSDESDGDDNQVGQGDAAVAGDDGSVQSKPMEIVPLSESQAEAVHQVQITMAALQASLSSLIAIGALRAAQVVEQELGKEKRKQRAIIKESPAVADAFLQLNRAEEQAALKQKKLVAQQNDRKREAAKAIADKNAAVAEMKKTKRCIQELESTRACKHSVKTYTLDALGAGSENAGGAKGKRNRLEVLDRLSRLKAGLSAGQRNDWPWFKDAWDEAMLDNHGKNWASVFSGWVQHVLDDERSNAFSAFVYNETCRVLSANAALHVPGA